MKYFGVLIAAVLLTSGCRSPRPATEIVVEVDSSIDPARLQSARITVERPGGVGGAPLFQSGCICTGSGAGCVLFPLTLGLGPDAMAANTGPFTVVATGYSDPLCGTSLVEQSATVEFVVDETLLLQLQLIEPCIGVTCPPGQTCVDASRQCKGDGRGMLPTFAGTPDGSVATSDGAVDAGFNRMDAGMPDLTMPDLAMPDLAMPDLAMPDLAMPDLAMPDLAMPDFAMPDLAMPDLAMPDLAMPDLVKPDLAMPDLLPPPDLRLPPPILNSVSPNMGPTTGGIALTLDGANFVQGAKVNIAGVDAAGVYVSGTRLTATLPADLGGIGKTTVVVTNPDGQSTTRTDVLKYYPGMLAFAPKVDYTTGMGPISLATGDWNGDKKPDLAAANDVDGTVSVLLGNGDGTFQPKVDYPTGARNRFVVTGDWNKDGKPDLATANYVGGTITVLLGNGDGTFKAGVNYADPEGGNGIATGDFNGDSNADLAVANYAGGNISIFLGNGDGTFQPRVDYAGCNSADFVVAGDWNGDRKVDLAIADDNCASVSVLLGNGDGSFKAHVEYAVDSAPTTLAVADYNVDGKIDFAVSNMNSGTLSLLFGNGDGTFQAKSDITTGPVDFVATADWNGDATPDLAVIAGIGVEILLGNGNGTFRPHMDFATGTGPFPIAVGDWNVDGKTDLAVGNWAADVNYRGTGTTVSVLLNTSQ